MYLCASLSEAVWQCDTAKVRQLLGQGADPNESYNGEPPLLPAARMGSAGCVGTLLGAGADPGWTRSDGTTALHTACRGSPLPSAAPADHMHCIQLLLDAGADLDAQTVLGVTPLHEAVMFQRPAIALTLLAAGADPNIANTADETPLHTACRNGDFDMAWLLLAGGASATAASCTGDTPMHRANGSSRSGHKTLRQLLLEAGADVNARGCDGSTPLFHAGMADLEILLAAGADVHARNSTNQTALHGCWAGEALARLLAAGADANARDTKGETPLHKEAGMKGLDERRWRVLLDAGADPNIANYSGVTPLLYLDPRVCGYHGSSVRSDEERCSMAAALLAAGADINAAATQPFTHPQAGKRPAGTTFLHMHAGCGFMGVSRCVQLALQAGANVRAVDGKGRTPLDLAATPDLRALLAAHQKQQEEPQQVQQPAELASLSLLSLQHFPPLDAPPRPGAPASAKSGPAPADHLPPAAAAAGGTAALPLMSQQGRISPSVYDNASQGQQNVQHGGDFPCRGEPQEGGPAAAHEAAEGQQQQQSARQEGEQGVSNVLGSSEAAQPAAGGVAVLASREDVAALPVRVLTAMLRTLGVDHRGCTEKRELVELLAGRAACPLRQGGQQAQLGQQAEGPGSPGAAGCSREGGGSDSSERGVSVGGPCGAQGQSESQEQQGQSESQEHQGSDTAKAPHPARHCACCGVASGLGVRLKLCSGCYSVRYCGGVCQLQAWPQHKAACRAIQHGG